MSYCVYKHTFPNEKVYIGITGQKPEQRWKVNGQGYTRKNKEGEYSQPLIAKAVYKYGWNNVKHEILFNNLTKEEAEQKEIELIDYYKSNQRKYGYNVQNGGNTTGTHSEETRKKISESNKGKIRTKETRKKMSDVNKGKTLTDETKQKISDAITGKILTEETKQRISDANKGRKLTEEHKNHLSEVAKERFANKENNPMYGKHHSEETKQKIRDAHKGKRIGENNPFYGMHHTEEYLKKISKKVRCIETNEIYKSIADAQKELGIAHISDVCCGRRGTAGGCHWEFVA